jgi:hypothetical protein
LAEFAAANFLLAQAIGVEKIPQIRLLLDILLASLGWFFLAHLLLPKLYVPARYTQHSLRVLMAIAAGIVLTLLLDRLRQWRPQEQWKSIALKVGGILLAIMLIVPQIPTVFLSENAQLIGGVPNLYEFFAQQPKDVMIASLSEEVNSVPTFSQRSILVGREYVLPYHIGYYREMRQRAIDLLTAQYSSDPVTVKNFVDQYGVDFFVLDRDAFEVDYIDDSDWLEQFQPVAEDAIDRLERKERPILQRAVRECTVLRLRRLSVLEADCVVGVSP